ncbi:imidazole glycerol phosphate synthase subunit HisH [Streptococcus gallolyticus]|uniref:imidazole glycerol phosphate synthase subunit HisH n=1 Tax=Streptococcus hepaticus TaxID=3349163 RepID=UPI001C96E528|nr:imidazole glycerol phosphate synthase subunit HisH [Streptococcus gallolyticus]MBY5041318.1 imidazole glycerol phosphate synthase subunit HisH [Streptococcus gallolyticus]
MKMVVIDYDAGNTANVLRALAQIGVEAVLSADAAVIAQADGLILPGVGAFASAMAELNKRGLVPVIKQTVATGTPLLGICLGMQILLDKGLEHGETEGLGLIPGTCRPIEAKIGYPVPHMGWNELTVLQETVLAGNLDGKSVYFVHSFYTDVPQAFIDVTADYSLAVPAMIHKEKVFGAQFHPEKSGEVGLGILKVFSEVVYANYSSN